MLTAMLIVGCGKAAINGGTQASPFDISKGTTDPELIGTWKSPTEKYKLASDGTFTMHYDRMEQVGPSAANKVRKVGDIAGRWAVDGTSLMFLVEKGESGSKHKMDFDLSKDGKTLEIRATYVKKGAGMSYKRLP